jgi:hypothetical protein
LNIGLVALAERAVEQVLQLPAAAVAADHDVDLAVGPEAHDAAVAVAAQRLVRVGLERVQTHERAVERQVRAVPDVAVDVVAEQRHLGERRAVGARRALRARTPS